MNAYNETNRKTPQKGHWIRPCIHALVLFLFVGAGWYLRGLIPGGAPAGGPPGGAMGGPTGPVQVVVETVKEGPAKPPSEYIGHVKPIQTVDIFAQVTGYLDQVQFIEGSFVREGDLLFTIEQEPYQARVDLAQASLLQARANLAGAKAEYKAAQANMDAVNANLVRAQKYLKRLENADPRSVVQSNLDTAISDEKQARSQVEQSKAKLEQTKSAVQKMEALVKSSQANLDLAHIDLGYTKIHSPITGRIGKAALTQGNYVGPSSGSLARIVQIDPIRVVFSMSDREYIALKQENAKRQAPKVRTRLRLPNGSMYSELGNRDFAENEMNQETGTLSVYTRFDNKKELLIPNSYVTVLLERENVKKVPMIPQEAAVADQQGHYVFIVNNEGIVEKRRVVTGNTIGGDIGIESGLSPGEKVVLHGLQKVKDGQQVEISSPSAQGGE
ncbi:efflux RND transporter periplasmic adaptor subunit [bacterium]|nr:efflux RND transporter periplasmic adaptor subunit [bacterium]